MTTLPYAFALRITVWCVKLSGAQLSVAASTVALVHKALMESEMNKIICTIVTASVLVGGAAYGQNKTKTTHDKQPLRDSQMDKVTAAGEENSSIAANNSTVNENNTGTVNLWNCFDGRQRRQHRQFF